MDMFFVCYLDVPKQMGTLLAKVKHAFSMVENLRAVLKNININYTWYFSVLTVERDSK